MPLSPTSTALPNVLLDALVKEEYKGCAKCIYLPPEEGGRRIVTARRVQLGEVVGRAKHQMTVYGPSTPQQQKLWAQVCEMCGDEEEYGTYFVWGALHSLLADEMPSGTFPLPSITANLQELICLAFIPDIIDASPKVKKLHSELGLRCAPSKFEQLIQLWNCNAVDHTYLEEISILSLSFALINHSCMPTVSWEVQGDEIVLRATSDLEAGAELSITYIEDDDMHMPTKLRQDHIVTTGKGFVCGCSRCVGPERCRHVMCPVAGCDGIISLGPPHAACMKCDRALTGPEVSKYVAMESKLQEILENHMDGEPMDENGDADVDKAAKAPLIAPPRRTQNLHDITPKQLALVREVATSGDWLAPNGHWLAHQAYGLLKDLAWSQNACLTTILDCLQKRADFVSQAYPTAAPNPPPFFENALELLEAAELLLKGDTWPAAWTQQKRHAAARPLLEASVGVLMTMRGSENCHVRKARKYLMLLQPTPNASALKRGQKRSRSCEDGCQEEQTM